MASGGDESIAPKWIGFLVFIWFVGLLVTLIGEGAVITANETSVLNKVMGWQQTSTQTDWNLLTFVGNTSKLFAGIWKMLWMDFSFWTDSGGWDIVRIAIASPIIATIVVGLILTFFSIFSKNA